MPKGLTDRQRRFVDAYAASRRGAESAVAAGYSAKWAASAASRLLKLPEVQAALQRRVDAASGKVPRKGNPETPLDALLDVMNDPEARIASRVRAAIAALPYCHVKAGARVPGGKKAQKQAAAEEMSGRFPTTKPPANVVRLNPKPRDRG